MFAILYIALNLTHHSLVHFLGILSSKIVNDTIPDVRGMNE